MGTRWEAEPGLGFVRGTFLVTEATQLCGIWFGRGSP